MAVYTTEDSASLHSLYVKFYLCQSNICMYLEVRSFTMEKFTVKYSSSLAPPPAHPHWFSTHFLFFQRFLLRYLLISKQYAYTAISDFHQLATLED